MRIHTYYSMLLLVSYGIMPLSPIGILYMKIVISMSHIDLSHIYVIMLLSHINSHLPSILDYRSSGTPPLFLHIKDWLTSICITSGSRPEPEALGSTFVSILTYGDTKI